MMIVVCANKGLSGWWSRLLSIVRVGWCWFVLFAILCFLEGSSPNGSSGESSWRTRTVDSTPPTRAHSVQSGEDAIVLHASRG